MPAAPAAAAAGGGGQGGPVREGGYPFAGCVEWTGLGGRLGKGNPWLRGRREGEGGEGRAEREELDKVGKKKWKEKFWGRGW